MEIPEMDARQGGIRIPTDMIKNSKNVVCECGGMIFKEQVLFKVISPLISPTGKEETVPMPVFVCTKCGKVPDIFDPYNVLPDEIKSKKV